MTQLIYYVAPWDRETDVEQEKPEVHNSTPGNPMELRHGFTLAQLDRIAALATNTGRQMAMHYLDRREEAWGAIVEHLYSAETAPTAHQLVEVGRNAIYALVRSERREQGFYREHTDGTAHGPGSSPKFQQYWEFVARAVSSPEGGVVERLALKQILPHLSPGQRDAVNALAACGYYQDAADLAGMTMANFKSQLAKGRGRCRKLWHEGEATSKPWGCDRRADRTGARNVMEVFTRRRRDGRKKALADAAGTGKTVSGVAS